MADINGWKYSGERNIELDTANYLWGVMAHLNHALEIARENSQTELAERLQKKLNVITGKYTEYVNDTLGENAIISPEQNADQTIASFLL